MPTGEAVEAVVMKWVGMARRARAGFEGLGPGPLIAWSLSRLRRSAETVPENTSLTWVVANDDTTTLIWIHEYWSDAYRCSSVHLAAELIDAGGATVAAWTVPLDRACTVAEDVRARCTAFGVPLPFEGQLLLRARADGLVAGRPVQVLAEYVSDDGARTGVHGQYGLMNTPAGQAVGAVRVDARPGARTAVVLTNAYDGPGGPRSARIRASVANASGKERHAWVSGLAPRATRRVALEDLFPDLARFLNGVSGSAEVILPWPGSRVATETWLADGNHRVINHGSVTGAFQSQPGVPARWSGPGPVASVRIETGEDVDTIITLPNRWGPTIAPRTVRMTVYDAGGERIAMASRAVPARGSSTVSMKGVLRDAGVEVPTVAHAELTIDPSDRRGPAMFEVLLGRVENGDVVAEVQVGTAFFNAAPPRDYAFPDIRRTRIFTRVVDDRDTRTRVFLAYPRADRDEAPATRALVSLIGASGERRVDRELEIPPHGFKEFSMRDLFPQADAILASAGVGSLRVRDTGARLYGFHSTRRDGAATPTYDHLIGG